MNKLSKNNTDPGANGCSPTTAREYLNIDEFAQRVGLSPKTIRRRIEAGHLPAWQPGGARTRILIPVNCLPGLTTTAEKPKQTQSNSPEEGSRKLSGPPPKWKQK